MRVQFIACKVMQRLVHGQWDSSEFLVEEPGQKIAENLMNNGIIKAE